MLTTKKQLSAALAALVKLAPRRAEFWGVVTITPDTMTAALAGDYAVTVSGEQAQDAGTVGIWELSPGWKVAAEMVKKYPHELIALETDERGVLCIQGAEFARPVNLDIDAARARVEELRPAYEQARATHANAEQHEQWAYDALQAYGRELFPAGGWRLPERKRRPLTTDEEQRRGELSAAHQEARRLATAAKNEYAAASSALSAANGVVAHIERVQAGETFCSSVYGKLAQPAASVSSKTLKPLAQLAGKFAGSEDSFKHVWGQGGDLFASDGYAISSTKVSGEDIGGAWGGAGLLALVSVAGAKNPVRLHADGWASCEPVRGVSFLAQTVSGETGTMPNFARVTSGAEVAGQFAIYAGHGERLAKLAKLFDEVAVSAGGIFYHSEQVSGREAWEDAYHPMGACELPADIAHIFTPQGLTLLKLGGRFELLKPAKGVYMLRRAECGTVAAGKTELSDAMSAVMASYEVAAPMPSLLEPKPMPEVSAEQLAPAEVVEPTPAPQEKPRYRLHLDGTFEHISGPVLDVPEHRRYQPSGEQGEQGVSGPTEPVSAPSVAPVSAPAIRNKRRAPVRPVRGVVACLEFSGVGRAAA